MARWFPSTMPGLFLGIILCSFLTSWLHGIVLAWTNNILSQNLSFEHHSLATDSWRNNIITISLPLVLSKVGRLKLVVVGSICLGFACFIHCNHFYCGLVIFYVRPFRKKHLVTKILMLSSRKVRYLHNFPVLIHHKLNFIHHQLNNIFLNLCFYYILLCLYEYVNESLCDRIGFTITILFFWKSLDQKLYFPLVLENSCKLYLVVVSWLL